MRDDAPRLRCIRRFPSPDRRLCSRPKEKKQLIIGLLFGCRGYGDLSSRPKRRGSSSLDCFFGCGGYGDLSSRPKEEKQLIIGLLLWLRGYGDLSSRPKEKKQLIIGLLFWLQGLWRPFLTTASLVAGVTETFPHDLKRRNSSSLDCFFVAGGPHDLKRKASVFFKTLAFLVAGVGLEPHDLRVMSPTSYQLLHPAISALQPLYVNTLRRFCQGRMGSNGQILKDFGYFGQFD